VLDVAIAGRLTSARVRRALPATARTASLRRGRLPPRPAARRHVDRWFARLGAYARARLRLALPSEPGTDPVARFLRLAATITTTPTAIDVEFELADLPIEVRVAGLDRDPGWLPAAGRSIRFHFR